MKFNPKQVQSIYTIKVVLSGIIRLTSALADIINKHNE